MSLGVAHGASCTLRLGVDVLRRGRSKADKEAHAHGLNENSEHRDQVQHLARDPSRKRRGTLRRTGGTCRGCSSLVSAVARVAVERVRTTCTLPDMRSTWFWIMSNPAIVAGSPAIRLYQGEFCSIKALLGACLGL